jgi:hypothetical protein
VSKIFSTLALEFTTQGLTFSGRFSVFAILIFCLKVTTAFLHGASISFTAAVALSSLSAVPCRASVDLSFSEESAQLSSLNVINPSQSLSTTLKMLSMTKPLSLSVCASRITLFSICRLKVLASAAPSVDVSLISSLRLRKLSLMKRNKSKYSARYLFH